MSLAMKTVIGLLAGYWLARVASYGTSMTGNYSLISGWWMAALLCKGSKLTPKAFMWLVVAALLAALAAVALTAGGGGLPIPHYAVRIAIGAAAIVGAALFGVFVGWLDVRWCRKWDSNPHAFEGGGF